MKKIFKNLIVLMIVILLTACTSKDDTVKETQTADPDEQTAEIEHASDKENKHRFMVVYFSRTGEQYTVGVIDKGNTAIVAEMIAEITDADLFEILPMDDHYPITYSELTDVAKKEQNEKARPEYSKEVLDLKRYDVIFIGAPV